MHHIVNIIIKWGLAFLMLFLLSYLYTGLSLYNMMVASFAVAVVSYVLGDLFVLPRTGNLVATLGDFGLAFLTLWLVSYAMNMGFSITYLAITSVVIAVSEILFHIYLESQHQIRRRV